MFNSILCFEEHCIKNFEKLEDEFLKNPRNFAEYVFGITDLLCKSGTEMLRDSLETMDRMLCESAFRRKSWTIEAHHTKTLITSLGDLTFRKTLFLNRQTKQHFYLLDQILGLEPEQRLTEDVAARMLEEAVQTSYRCGAQQASLGMQVGRQTVKNRIHALKFPPAAQTSEPKKKVDRLYIDADEDHVALQFREKRTSVLDEFREIIRNQTKNDFRALVGKQKKEMPKWRNRTKAEEAVRKVT